MPAKGSSFWIFFFAYLILAGGVMNVAWDLYERTRLLVPANMALVVGEAAWLLMGLLALTIAQCARNLEDRLSKIESERR